MVVVMMVRLHDKSLQLIEIILQVLQLAIRLLHKLVHLGERLAVIGSAAQIFRALLDLELPANGLLEEALQQVHLLHHREVVLIGQAVLFNQQKERRHWGVCC